VRANLIDTSSHSWSDVIGRARHDFYHLPGYVEVSAREDGGEPRALLVEDDTRELLLPLVMMPLGDGASDATSPYGYPGPITTGEHDDAWVSEALLVGERFLAESGVVSLFVRLHPLLNPVPPVGVGTLVQHGDTVTVDLTLPPDEQWRNMRRNHRQQIRQSLDAGYSVFVDDDRRHYDEFKRLYHMTMQRRSAAAYYHFGDHYFEDLRTALGDRLHVAMATVGDEFAAAALFVETDGIVQMHLTGHDDRFSRDQPTKIVFDLVRTWATSRGNRALHLGGGVGGDDDSLLHFKAGFSKVRQPFYTLRHVIRPDEYRRRVAAHDGSADPNDLTGPFPAYRRQ